MKKVKVVKSKEQEQELAVKSKEQEQEQAVESKEQEKVKVVKSKEQEQAVESKEQEQEQAVESKEYAGQNHEPNYKALFAGLTATTEVPPISKEGLNSMIDDMRFIIAMNRTQQLQKMTEADVKAEVVKLYTSLDLDRAAKEAAQLQSEWATAQNMRLKERQETLFEKKRAQLEELEGVVYDVLFTKAYSLLSQVKMLAKHPEFIELISANNIVSPLFHRTNNGYVLNMDTGRIAFEFGPVTARAKMAKARLLSVPRTNSTPTTECSYKSQRIIVNGKEYKWKRTAARSLLKDNTISTKDAVSRLREAGYNVEE